MKEIWKDIPGYEGIFQASSLGEIKNVISNKILGQSTFPSRGNKYYLRCSLNGHPYKVHRLVALAFLPNIENKPDVDHIDFNEQNNRVDNLRWVSKSENSLHSKDRLAVLRRGELHWKCKLSDRDVLRLFELRKSGMRYAELSKIFGLKENTLCAIVTRGRKYLKNN